MTLRQLLSSALGLTQASSVMPVLRWSEVESAMLTMSWAPSKLTAPWVWPVLLQVAADSVPLLPEPESSATVEPLPASNEYAATSPAVPAADAERAPDATAEGRITSRSAAAKAALRHERAVPRARKAPNC